MRSTHWLAALVLALAVACANAAAALATPAPLLSTAKTAPVASTAKACTTSAAEGSCGPYNSYRGITGATSSTNVGNNVWNQVQGWRQILTSTSPGDWHVTANMPAGNTAVVSYPSSGAPFGKVTNQPTPLTAYSMIRSAFTERMNATARTSAWAAYDIWLGPDGSSDWSHEVMIQNDFANNGVCTTVARARFPGPRGALQRWHLCKFGSELIWKLGANDHNKVSERTGVVHILAVLRWLVHHGYLPTHTGLWMIGYGWEICSTGGRPETFTVSAYTLRARCEVHACR